MRRNRRLLKPLAMLLIALMICLTVVGQTGIRPVQADSGNLADKAVAFLKSEYETKGAESGIGPYEAYVLHSAGVDVSEWKHNDKSLPEFVTDLVNQDIDISTGPAISVSVKRLAEDLIAMQELDNSGLVDQLKILLQNRRNDDGSFQDDSSVYSIIPAYELLGRAGQLSVVNAGYAQTYILGQQAETGAWPKAWNDFMCTAQAVRALNYLDPEAAPNSAVEQAIAKGCSWLKAQQQPDGSFKAGDWDDPLIDTVEAIATQKALDLSDAWITTADGQSAVDYLNNSDSVLNADGSFGSSKNVMDATWALYGFKLLGILPTGDGGSGGDPSPSTCTPGIAVVGMSGEILFGPATVTVFSNNEWGLTALGALDATGLSYTTSTTWDGFVDSIDGQEGSGMGGWMYTVNGTTPMVMAKDYDVSSGDKVIWYYSKSMGQKAPTWDQLTSVSVRVRVEGITSDPVGTTVIVAGSALDALNEAVGSDKVVAPGGFITGINGESGDSDGDPPTSWFYYAIRNGEIDPDSFGSAPSGYNVQDGDQVVFYIGAYDASTYAAKTYLPVVSVSPQAPTAGQTITISISAKKYDWSTGLKDLSAAEAAEIGDYTLTVGETTYTSSDGQVTLPNVTAGTLSYVITNQNNDGYPNVVPYRGSINVGASGNGGGDPSPSTCTSGIAVVGRSGEKLFGPATVNVLSTNRWGLTALGALEATGLSYIMSTTFDGFVDSIAGQAGSGMEGWMYTVNDTAPMVAAKDYDLSSGDKVIWYYSKSMEQEAPTWAQLSSGALSGSTLPTSFVTSTTGEAVVNPAAGGNVGLGSDVSVNIPAGALNGTAGVDVAIRKASDPPAAPAGFKLLGSVFEFTVGDSTGYKFKQPVTLTFSFDPAALPQGVIPSVYYYDETSLKWVELGGTISGNTITVSVDHFTKFATFVKEVASLPVPAQVFTDVQASLWASDAINRLYSLGYVNGYPDGTFRPDNRITRAEFVSILNKALNLPSSSSAAPAFSDVTSEDWFYEAVENAVHAGIIKGYGNNLFKPNNEINREELATIMVNALAKHDEAKASMNEKTGFTDDDSISDWARGFVVVAAKTGLINGYPDNSFKPQGSATRAEACTIIINFLDFNKSIL